MQPQFTQKTNVHVSRGFLAVRSCHRKKLKLAPQRNRAPDFARNPVRPAARRTRALWQRIRRHGDEPDKLKISTGGWSASGVPGIGIKQLIGTRVEPDQSC